MILVLSGSMGFLVGDMPTFGVEVLGTPASDYQNTAIAFVIDSSIYTVLPDGSSVKQVTEGGDPAWSPDHKYLAFDYFDSKPDKDIFIINSDRSGRRKLTNDITVNRGPQWSPDGTKIAFECYLQNIGDPLSWDDHQICLINADGTSEVQLTKPPGGNYGFSWSPDGTRIAFMSTREGRNQIFVMNSDGSHQINISHSQTDDVSSGSWSPDGTRIAFSTIQHNESDHISGTIYVVDSDGYNPVNLTPDDFGLLPLWSPDGHYIAYEKGKSHHLAIMQSDGSHPVEIGDDQAVDVTGISWSPDGSHLAFTDSLSDLTRNGVKIFDSHCLNQAAGCTESDVITLQGTLNTVLDRNGTDTPHSVAWSP